METEKEVVKININNIIPNRFQPRISFDEQALNELANSIKMYGILQPLILRPLGDKYEIIAGERRYKAATIAGLTEVPAILVNLDDQTSAELALIENIQRKDLTAIEEAKSYKKLLDLGNYTQDELATKMGKSQSSIANKLRLLNLTQEAQNALMNNLISERHARSLLQLKDNPEKQKEVLNRITSERMTVKETDEIIKSIMGGNNMIENNLNNENAQNSQSINNLNNNLYIQQPELKTPNLNMNSFNTPEKFNLPNSNITEQSIVDFNNNEMNTSISSFDIPNLNNDTFNLSQISDPNLNIPTTPINNQIPSYDFTSPSNEIQNPTNPENSTDFSIPNFDSLLQVEEPKEEIIKEEEPKPTFAPATAPTNKYFPDLEKEPANMSFSNPYASAIPNIESQSTTQPNMNMTEAINEVREITKNLEEKGYKLTTEELDQPDSYQITIKIKKDTTVQ